MYYLKKMSYKKKNAEKKEFCKKVCCEYPL